MHNPWTCACCGREFDELPLDVAIGRGPAAYEDLTDEERPRALLTSDFCVIQHADQIDRFIRAVIEVPVLGLRDDVPRGEPAAIRMTTQRGAPDRRASAGYPIAARG